MLTLQKKAIIAAGITALMLDPSPTAAQDFADLKRCASINDNTKRLSCYDTAMATSVPKEKQALSLPTSTAEKNIAVKVVPAKEEAKIEAEVQRRVKAQLEAEEIKRKKQEEFNAFTKPQQAAKPKIINATVKATNNNNGRGMLILIDNGSLWQQDGGTKLYSLKKGAKVEIKPGVLGSYWISVIGKKGAIKVKLKRR